MAEFNKLMTKFVTLSLLVLGLFSFIAFNQQNNGVEEKVVDDETFNRSFGEISQTIQNASASAEQQYNVFNDEAPKPSTFSIVLFGIVSFGKTFSNMVFGFFISIIKFPLIMFGIDPNVANMMTIVLIIAVVCSAWILYKIGG